jgi:pimeloyl-ACP methyl ester carboxylesterase
MTAPPSRFDTTFDVTTPAGPATIAATVATPTGPPSGRALICLAGAGYTRAYWTKAYAGGPDFLARLAADGHVVVALDNLGMGQSSVPADPDTVDLEAMGAAAAHVLRTVRQQLVDGELAGLNPIPAPTMVLVGHSMGGAVTIVAQATNAAADAVAVLGSTTLELAGLVPMSEQDRMLSDVEARAWAQEYRAPLLWGKPWAETDPLIDYDREPFRAVFYAADVPAEVIAADEADGTPTPRIALLECATPALFAPRAAEITVPVFLGFGAQDLSPDPAGELPAYRGSNDITLFRLPGSAHVQNVATTRELLWDRLSRWVAELA